MAQDYVTIHPYGNVTGIAEMIFSAMREKCSCIKRVTVAPRTMDMNVEVGIEYRDYGVWEWNEEVI